MCTITYSSSYASRILSFNRDEEEFKSDVEFPIIQNLINKKIYYPKDIVSGGTWIIADNMGGFCCLFNGGFTNHIKKKEYRKSRGLLLFELCKKNINEFIKIEDFNNIEPFSMIILEKNELYYLVWDEVKIYLNKLNKNENYLWSSCTLYGKDQIEYRQKKYKEFIEKNKNKINPEEVKNFLINDFNVEKYEDFKYYGDKKIKTISFTQIIIEKKKTKFEYIDLKNSKRFNYIIDND